MSILEKIIKESNLKFTRIKNNDTSVFLGKYQNKPIVIYLKHILPKNIQNTNSSNITLSYKNDRFTKYNTNMNCEIECNVVWPANEKEVSSSKKQIRKRIFETPEMYQKLIYPKVINTSPKWMQNIIDEKNEQEYILYQDEHFVLMPDTKWNGEDIQDIHCLGIVKNTKLMSIRDLNSSHIPLLEHIYKIGLKVMNELYNIDDDELRVYFHYHPTYWQLHVHFNSLNIMSRGTGIDFAISLKTVVRNIKLVPDYYQKATLEVLSKF